MDSPTTKRKEVTMKKVNVYRIDMDCVEGEIKTIALSDVSYHEAVVYCQSRPVTRFVKYVITSPADGLCGNCQSCTVIKRVLML